MAEASFGWGLLQEIKPHVAWKMLTGKAADELFVGLEIPRDDDQAIWNAIDSGFSSNKLVLIGTKKGAPDIVDMHVYWAEDRDTPGMRVFLQNPWGWTPDPQKRDRLSLNELSTNVGAVFVLDRTLAQQ